MANHVRVLSVSDRDLLALQRQVRAKGSPARAVERARIVLLAADGLPGKEIGRLVGCSEPTVVLWRNRLGLPRVWLTLGVRRRVPSEGWS